MRDLERFLNEDLGRRGDVTTQRLFSKRPIPARARLYARERIVVAGTREAIDVFARLGVRTVHAAPEGRVLAAGRSLLEVDGPLQGILTGERLALNILARMSGIATQTRLLADRVRRVNPRCRVAATRKTTPGFREYEKRAVILGGGEPHRMGLYDGILVKDNHLVALAPMPMSEVVARARRGPGRLPVEVEVGDADSARQASEAGADWILIDNVPPRRAAAIARVARHANPNVKIEVSGGLGPHNLLRYAPFADRLSLGLLTHSARSADVTLDMVGPKR